MTWTWFDLAWPWIGSLAACVLLVLLFATDKLRSNPAVPRWRDPVWLAWWAVPVYMLHNVEEYGIDLLGKAHAFPDAMCSTLHLAPYPACPVPPPFFLAVNLSLVWIAAPVAALVSPKHRLVGFAMYGVLITNGLTHIAPLVLGKGYTPGTLSAVLLFLPSFFLLARTFFGPGRLPYQALAVLVGAGVVLHAVLLGSLLLFLRGAIGTELLVALQLLNSLLFLLIPWTAERHFHLTEATRVKIEVS